MRQPVYVLITAARNEEEFIEKTIKSVVNQTVLPQKWVIISDGSTDRTDEIGQKYAAHYGFIHLVRATADAKRNFGSKVKAVTYGYSLVKDSEFDFIGNLDADITLNPNYYEFILKEFARNKKLGVAGGHRRDNYKGKFVKVNCALNSVGGPYQMFRRECFEAIGGFMPLEYGAEDAVAEITARMKGWEVRSFPQIISYHHRYTGGATRNPFVGNFKTGYRFYLIGYHPLFTTLAMLKKAEDKPYGGSLVSLLGYFWAALRHFPRPVSPEFVNYLHREQISRIKEFLRKGKDPVWQSNNQETVYE